MNEEYNPDSDVQYGETGCLNFHMGKCDASLQDELNDTVQRLYEKYVPQATREYIDARVARDAVGKDRPRRPVRPAARRAECVQVKGRVALGLTAERRGL